MEGCATRRVLGPFVGVLWEGGGRKGRKRERIVVNFVTILRLFRGQNTQGVAGYAGRKIND
jgi:hypothetical protein